MWVRDLTFLLVFFLLAFISIFIDSVE
jgi:hypothetical protein